MSVQSRPVEDSSRLRVSWGAGGLAGMSPTDSLSGGVRRPELNPRLMMVFIGRPLELTDIVSSTYPMEAEEDPGIASPVDGRGTRGIRSSLARAFDASTLEDGSE